MMTATDGAIVAFTRTHILADAELADQIPDRADHPWYVDLEADRILTQGGQPAGDPLGFPQYIKPAVPGIATEAIIQTFTEPGQPVFAQYLIAAAEPRRFRAGYESRLATLGLCHRLLSAVSDEMVCGAVRLFLRHLAAGYAHCEGYNPAWSPDLFQLELTAAGAETAPAVQ